MRITRRQLRQIILEQMDVTVGTGPGLQPLTPHQEQMMPLVLQHADWEIRDAGLDHESQRSNLVDMYKAAYDWSHGQGGRPSAQIIAIKLGDLIEDDTRRRNLAQYGQEMEEMPPEGMGMTHDVMGETDPLYEAMPDSWKQILGGCLGDKK
jgi:hypothetical protein